MMGTVHEKTQAEEDGRKRQGDEGVDGHVLLHGPPTRQR